MSDTAELIARCLAGDDVAKAEFLLAYGDFVRRVVAGKLATMSAHAPVRQDVEDIANDVLVRLLDNECSLLAQVRDRGRIAAWLSRVARNFTVDYVRKWNNRMKAQGLAVRETEAMFAPGPDEAAVREELQLAARTLMAGLAPRERLVLELYYVHGMPYAEIAQLTGLNINTVATQLRRARLHLVEEAVVIREEVRHGA